jgi:hypothetical protein
VVQDNVMDPASVFLDRELALLQSIVGGKAVEHHLEPSYYEALANAAANMNRSAAALDEAVT